MFSRMTDFATERALAVSDYLDNADYMAEDSVSKAKLFQTACRKLQLMPKSIEQGGSAKVEFEPSVVKDQLAIVTSWLSTHSDNVTGGGVKVFSFENLRD